MSSDGFLLLLSGATTTLCIACASIVLSLLVALVVGILVALGAQPLGFFLWAYIELFIGTSLVVQLFWMYFVLPQFGVLLSELTVALVAISLNYGAYGSVIVRGAVKAISRDQWEAAGALGLGRRATLQKVILPQAAVLLIRPLGVLFVQLVKATSLVSLITIADLTYRAYQLNQLSMQVTQIFGVVLVIYYGMTKATASLAAWLDTNVGRWRRYSRTKA